MGSMYMGSDEELIFDTPSESHLNEIADIQHGKDSDDVYYLSHEFRSPEADVIFQSSDKVKFHLFKKELAILSGGFPPAELVSDPKEIVKLPEGAVVLNTLFAFTRPQRYPDLHDLEIEGLVELGDVAEKYEVYPAIMACKIIMRMKISAHPLEVFVYAAKYDYLDLLDATAPSVLGTPLLELDGLELPRKFFTAWLRYLDALEPLRKVWINTIRMASQDPDGCDRGCYDSQSTLFDRLVIQMQNKTVLLEASHKQCSACSRDMTFESKFKLFPRHKFTASAIEKVYSTFPKFSTFLF
ncbi:hypothetical protein BDN72DRAFT_802477 [Pluteus cervinus]|uniref:Uncharacterized protein n=1 Tax=Pluteus cervinus TaxID=181527 RepID=A0ACD3AF02_9AGAR|nr:hypothetical protein BDN72DRAFT_802477 [Pluteus cervinus]